MITKIRKDIIKKEKKRWYDYRFNIVQALVLVGICLIIGELFNTTKYLGIGLMCLSVYQFIATYFASKGGEK